ncbi:MAG: hypothetical protein FIB08_03445 [Candidatus Methanoperedens sp.]|nr:hypothetical protein [Candidatus Methanoperedens sp.]
MGQEAENQINFESLKAIVNDAIENENISAILAIEDKNQLRYMQKFVEVKLSELTANKSIPSFILSASGIVFGIIAIGLTIFLVGVSLDDVGKIIYRVAGIILVIYGIWLFKDIYKYKGKFEKSGKEIKFMYEIILKIEETLIKKSLDKKKMSF